MYTYLIEQVDSSSLDSMERRFKEMSGEEVEMAAADGSIEEGSFRNRTFASPSLSICKVICELINIHIEGGQLYIYIYIYIYTYIYAHMYI